MRLSINSSDIFLINGSQKSSFLSNRSSPNIFFISLPTGFKYSPGYKPSGIEEISTPQLSWYLTKEDRANLSICSPASLT